MNGYVKEELIEWVDICFLVPDHLQHRFLTYSISCWYCSLSAYLTLTLCM